MVRIWIRLAALAAIAFSTAAPCKETLYATSLRSHIGGESFIAGNLYVVDPTTAVATLVGAIKVGDEPVGILALATHPKTGVVYGINAGLSPKIGRSLLEIDLDNATARVVARLATRGTDIGFAPDGTLYMWAADLRRLVRVDLETGDTTAIGETLEVAAGGAIAITPDGTEAIVAVNGATGRIYRIDVRSGFVTPGPELSNAPYDASIENLTYSPSGELYAVNSDGGTPAKAALVSVDAHIGFVSKIGLLPDDVRGLIFATERPSAFVSREALRFWLLVALAVVGAGLIVYAIWRT
jgi:DNA-binding beta-propeller fold protein YncE